MKVFFEKLSGIEILKVIFSLILQMKFVKNLFLFIYKESIFYAFLSNLVKDNSLPSS